MATKTLYDITGDDILQSYNLTSDDNISSEVDKKHFAYVWEKWRIDLINSFEKHTYSPQFSLNKKSFAGKLTRALLHAIGMQEPKTLGILLGQMWELHPEKD